MPPNYSADFKTVALTPLGVGASVGALNFVPAGFNGAGQFKIVSLDTNQFYTIPLTPDGSGGYDLGNATLETTLNTCTTARGAEAFVYVPLGSPLFTNQSMLVAEYGTSTVGSYLIDANGNPIPSSRRNLITGLGNAQLAAMDPLTGDILFATFGLPNRVILVRGFGPGAPSGSMAHLAAEENWTTTFTLVNKSAVSGDGAAEFFRRRARPQRQRSAHAAAGVSAAGRRCRAAAGGFVRPDARGERFVDRRLPRVRRLRRCWWARRNWRPPVRWMASPFSTRS